MMLWIGLSVACTGQSLQFQAEYHDLHTEVVDGDPFLHQLVFKAGKGSILHVYIEGDGRPWKTPQRIATDPDPKRRIMFELMLGDDAPALYLGRPCYFKLPDPQCAAPWWTDKRYSEAVVHSLDAALSTRASQYNGIVLMGHSGGGTLAMLLAARRPDTIAVITLAGNLDTRRWTHHHRYTPLYGSLNPAEQAPLNATIRQQHYLGEVDEVITRDMIAAVISKQYSADFYLLKGANHSCCWNLIWPTILARTTLSNKRLNQQFPLTRAPQP